MERKAPKCNGLKRKNWLSRFVWTAYVLVNLTCLEENSVRKWDSSIFPLSILRTIAFGPTKLFDIVNGAAPDPTPAGVNSDDPRSPKYLAQLAQQRRIIE